MEIVNQICHQVVAVDLSIKSNQAITTQEESRGSNSIIIQIHVQAGQFKLNCDGSVQLGTKKVAAGGVLHGQCGFVLFCYAHNVGFCSVIHAELWSILIGVWIAWSRGYKTFFMGSYSQVAIHLLQNRCSTHHTSSSIVQNIKEVIQNGGNINWSHILREANQVTNRLANFGLS